MFILPRLDKTSRLVIVRIYRRFRLFLVDKFKEEIHSLLIFLYLADYTAVEGSIYLADCTAVEEM